MTANLARLSTSNPGGTPTLISFDYWVGVPQKIQPVVEKIVRLGSKNIIRQVLRYEAVETQVEFGFFVANQSDATDFIAKLLSITDPTTYWVYEDTTSNVYTSRVAILKIDSYQIVAGSGATKNKAECNLLVKGILTCVADEEDTF
jgi:hypothetical protein